MLGLGLGMTARRNALPALLASLPSLDLDFLQQGYTMGLTVKSLDEIATAISIGQSTFTDPAYGDTKSWPMTSCAIPVSSTWYKTPLEVLCDFVAPLASVSRVVWSLDDGTADNRVELAVNLGVAVLNVVTGGVAQAAISLGTLLAGAQCCIAARIAADNVAAVANGMSITSDASATIPMVTTFRVGANYAGTTQADMVVSAIKIIPSLRTDAQILADSGYGRAAVEDRALCCYGDSMTLSQGSTAGNDWPSLIAADGGWITFNGGIGGQTSPQIVARALADKARKNWTAVFWMGRNNAGQTAQILADMASAIANIGHNRFLVIPILPRTDETTGTSPRQSVDTYNAALLAAYPDHYVDLYPYLCTDPGGVIPASLLSDGLLHLNDAGYYIVYQRVKSKLAMLAATGSDTIPNRFAFTPQIGLDQSSVAISENVKISGISGATPISITGGEYQINSGAWISTPGTVVNGDLVKVRVTTSAGLSATVQATMTVGGVSAVFSAKTAASANLVTNSTFDTDTAWTKGTNVTISGGTLNFGAANFQNARQNIAMTAGKTYRVSFDITSRSAGSVSAVLFGSTSVSGTVRSTVGSFVQDLVAPASPTQIRLVGGTSSDTLSIDNLTVKEL